MITNSYTPINEVSPVIPQYEFSKTFSHDIYTKHATTKGKNANLTVILPAQFALSASSEGEIGHLDMSDPASPQLIIAAGSRASLCFPGRYISSQNKFLSIELNNGAKKQSRCEIVDEFLVFDEPIISAVAVDSADNLVSAYHNVTPVEDVKLSSRHGISTIKPTSSSRTSSSSSSSSYERSSSQVHIPSPSSSSSGCDVYSDDISSDDEYDDIDIDDAVDYAHMTKVRPSRSSSKTVIYTAKDSDDEHDEHDDVDEVSVEYDTTKISSTSSIKSRADSAIKSKPSSSSSSASQKKQASKRASIQDDKQSAAKIPKKVKAEKRLFADDSDDDYEHDESADMHKTSSSKRCRRNKVAKISYQDASSDESEFIDD